MIRGAALVAGNGPKYVGMGSVRFAMAADGTIDFMSSTVEKFAASARRIRAINVFLLLTLNSPPSEL
jgi:hypothetical protein